MMHSYHVDLMVPRFVDIISREDQYEVAKARATITLFTAMVCEAVGHIDLLLNACHQGHQ